MAKTVEQIVAHIQGTAKSSSKSHSKEYDKFISKLAAYQAKPATSAEQRQELQYQRELAEAQKMTGDIPTAEEIWNAHQDTLSQWRSDAQKREIQRKKEEQQETAPVDSIQLKRDRAQKALDNFVENADFDATDTNARKAYDFEIDKLERQLSAADAEQDQRTMVRDLETIAAMSDEDRAAFEKYVRGDTYAGEFGTFRTDMEAIEAYKGLKSRYGDSLEMLKESYERNRDAEKAHQVSEETSERVQDGGWMMDAIRSVASVPANIIGGLVGTAGRINELFNRSGRYKSLSPYTIGDIPSVYGQTVQSEVTGKILDGQEMDLQDGISGRELGAMAYQGVTGAAETAGRMALSFGNPVIGAGLAATQSFANTVREASAQGATPQQAIALATVNAGIEAATEKMPLDELFKIAKNGTKGAGKVIMNILRQAGIEVMEEEASLIGTTLAEGAILREKSSYRQSIGDMVANGASYEEAREQADRNVLNEAKQTALVTALSGALSAGGAEYYNRQFIGSDGTEQAPGTAPAADNVQQVTAEAPQEIPAEPVQAAPATEETTDFIAETAQQQARMMPPEVTEPIPEGLQHFDNAAAIANGMEPKTLTPQERGLRYKASKVNAAILDMVERVKNGLAKGSEKVSLGKISDSNAAQIQRETGIDTRGYDVAIEARQIEHILKDHGENGSSNRSMANPEDIARIEYVLSNPDRITKSQPTKAYVTNKNGKMKPADTVLYETRLEDGSYYVVQAVPETKKKTLYVLTAFIGKSDYHNEAPQITNVNSPSATPEAESTVTSREATQSTNAVNPSATPNGESAGTSIDIVPDALTEVNRNPVAETDYYDEFEDWGRDPNREGVENPMADRNYSEVGKRGVKAYMYENPAVKPFYQEQAAWMLSELADTTKGERTYNEQLHYDSGGEKGWSGVKRHTSESIAELLDQDGMTYDQIEQGLNAIINDSGQENNAASKRIEFIINDRFMNGYTDFYTGQKVPGNAEYLELLRNQQSASGADTQMGASNQSPKDGQIKGTGAAERGFTPKQAMINEYGNIPEGENPARPDQLPASTDGTDSVSRTARTALEARVTPDEFVPLIENETVRGRFSFMRIHNDDTTQAATQRISREGWETSRANWTANVRMGITSPEITATGALLYNHAVNAGDDQEAMEILLDYQMAVRNSARSLQAARILKTLTPSDRLWMIRRSVEAMAEDMNLRNSVTINGTLAREYQNAPTEAEADEILDQIARDVARQIPATGMEAFTALRYLNMLGNFRTQARNIAGNAGSKIVYGFKDKIAASIELMAHHLSGGRVERTKSLVTDTATRRAALQDYDQVRDWILGGGRYNDRGTESEDFARRVQKHRRILPPGLEQYRRATQWTMDTGDDIFARSAYSRALAGYLNARGIRTDSLEAVDPDVLDRAREYAVRQAQEQTFRDNNQISDFVSGLFRGRNTPAWARVISEGIMPFRKTPANVLVRAEEFSPLGIINSLVNTVRAARGQISGAELIDSWAKTLTGTALVALGMTLYDSGVLSGGPDEDEDKAAFDRMNGMQEYAITVTVDGKPYSYTIDWATPAAMPMFLGAQLQKLLSQEEDLTWADYEKVLTAIGDPLIRMSMLQGLNDTLDNLRYADNTLGQFCINAATSYLTQGLTNTLFGQIERSTEDTRQTTYVNKDSNVPQWLQKQLGKASQKIPGWDYQQTDYINARGETEAQRTDALGWIYNLASSGYVDAVQVDKVSEELYRLHGAGVEGNVFPGTPGTTITWTDKTGTVHKDQHLTAEQAETLKKETGQISMRIVESMISSKDYAAMPDEQKAKAIQQVYSYARKTGEIAAIGDDHTGYDEVWMMELEEGREAQYILNKVTSGELTSAMDALDVAWDKGYRTESRSNDLKWAYDTFAAMSQSARDEVKEWATGTTAKYIEARENGVGHDQFISAAENIAKVQGTGSDGSVRDIDRREAIATTSGLDDAVRDKIMKCYMEDYDPDDESPSYTELKYDYIRQEMGLSAEEYAETYRAHLDNDKKDDKIAATVALGYDENVAVTLYNIYQSTSKGKAMYMTMAE